MASVRHPIFARFYAWLSRAAERTEVAAHRDELLEGLTGRVIEVGAGNGINLRHYPRGVTEVVAVEPEPFLRRHAEAEAAAAPVPAVVVDGVADRLGFPDGSFDAGVASLVLCSVPSQARALAELRRVIRPGGELRFYEHVRSERRGHARVQDLADLIWPAFAGGCRTGRDTPAAIARSGFEITHVRRFDFDPARLAYPVTPHVIGRARRPAIAGDRGEP